MTDTNKQSYQIRTLSEAKLDILLINSPLFRDKTDFDPEDSLPPLGLGYIASNLKTNALKVAVTDAVANNIPIEELIATINSNPPSFLGLNIFTPNFHLVQEIIERSHPQKGFIVGGGATKSTFEKILQFNTPHSINVVIGDGDSIVSAIVKDEVHEDPAFRQRNRSVHVVNNSSIYFPADISNLPLDRTFFTNEPMNNHHGLLEATIITSRGCIYNCAFCGAARSLNKDTPVRLRDTRSVRDEVTDLLTIYPGLESIRVLDDLFLRNPQTIEVATSIFSARIGWRSMAHILSFRGCSKQLLKDLKASGCNEVFIGIESGSARTLKAIHKMHELTELKETVFALLDTGIHVKSYFILGFPSETEHDFQETYELAKSLKSYSQKSPGEFRVSVFKFRPYHGTELSEKLHIRSEDEVPFTLDHHISEMIGRHQFNIVSKNYSACDSETLDKFIRDTMSLNTSDVK